MSLITKQILKVDCPHFESKSKCTKHFVKHSVMKLVETANVNTQICSAPQVW